MAQLGIGKALYGKVVSLAGRLPQIWIDPATSEAHRKALLRCLIDKVDIDRCDHDITVVRIIWRGGAVTSLDVKKRVNSVAKLTRGPASPEAGPCLKSKPSCRGTSRRTASADGLRINEVLSVSPCSDKAKRLSSDSIMPT